MIRSVLLAFVMVCTIAPHAIAQNTKPIGIPDPHWKKGEKYKITASQRIASMERSLFAYRYSMVRTWGVQVIKPMEEGDLIVRLSQLSANSDMNLGNGINKFRLKKKEWRAIMNLVEGLKSGFPMVFAFAKYSKMMRLGNEAEIKQRMQNEIAKLKEVRYQHPSVPPGTERFFGTLLEKELGSAGEVTADARAFLGRLMMFRRSAMVPREKYTGITNAVPFLGMRMTSSIEKMQGQDVLIHTYQDLADKDLGALGQEGLDLVRDLRKEYPSKRFDITGRVEMNHVVTWKTGHPKAYSERHTLNIIEKTDPPTKVGSLVIREVTVKMQRW